jgi:hypothetical protein
MRRRRRRGVAFGCARAGTDTCAGGDAGPGTGDAGTGTGGIGAG